MSGGDGRQAVSGRQTTGTVIEAKKKKIKGTDQNKHQARLSKFSQGSGRLYLQPPTWTKKQGQGEIRSHWLRLPCRQANEEPQDCRTGDFTSHALERDRSYSRDQGWGRNNLDNCLLEYQGNERTKEVFNQSEETNQNKNGGFPGLFRKGKERWASNGQQEKN